MQPNDATCGTQSWFWFYYTVPHKTVLLDSGCPFRRTIEQHHVSGDLCSEIIEQYDSLQARAKECVAPLYQDMLTRASSYTGLDPGYLLDMANDPVPCIHRKLAEKVKEMFKNKGACLMISVGAWPVPVQPIIDEGEEDRDV